MSILQGKDDIFLDMRQKFWNTYKVRQTFEKDNHDLSVSFFFLNIYLFIWLCRVLVSTGDLSLWFASLVASRHVRF